MELKVGGKYKIIKKIGNGAFGDIYLGNFRLLTSPGSSIRTGDEIAIKLVINRFIQLGTS
jgi:hypothetical protein